MLNVHHRAERGIFMTTADYSDPAKELGKQHHLLLIDGDDIVKMLNLTGERPLFRGASAGVNAARATAEPPTATGTSCPRCGTANNPLSKFCRQCGVQFAA